MVQALDTISIQLLTLLFAPKGVVKKIMQPFTHPSTPHHACLGSKHLLLVPAAIATNMFGGG